MAPSGGNVQDEAAVPQTSNKAGAVAQSADIMQSNALVVTDEASRRIFRFIDLPPELRNIVYKLAITRHNRKGDPGARVNGVLERIALLGRMEWKFSLSRRSRQQITPQLLSICKQIHREAAVFLYGQPLKFTCWTEVSAFLGARPLGCQGIRHIHVHNFPIMFNNMAAHKRLCASFLLVEDMPLLQIIGIRKITFQGAKSMHASGWSNGSKPCTPEEKSRRAFEMFDVLRVASESTHTAAAREACTSVMMRLQEHMVQARCADDGQGRKFVAKNVDGVITIVEERAVVDGASIRNGQRPYTT